MREMALAIIPAPTAPPHRVMTAYAASQFFARALSYLEL
ncbi:hypothetical protein [Sideroxydans sp. CL21]|nr:hypothetical protein [Sideroxydans sp. CL21]